jgi:hypothetical protein
MDEFFSLATNGCSDCTILFAKFQSLLVLCYNLKDTKRIIQKFR